MDSRTDQKATNRQLALPEEFVSAKSWAARSALPSPRPLVSEPMAGLLFARQVATSVLCSSGRRSGFTEFLGMSHDELSLWNPPAVVQGEEVFLGACSGAGLGTTALTEARKPRLTSPR